MPLTSKLTKALAIALMFWCAGAGCMMVSYARAGDKVTAVADSGSSASEEMAAVPACHAHKQKTRKAKTSKATTADTVGQFNLPTPSRSGAMSCCPLTTGSIAPASRSQSNSSAPAVTHPDFQLPNLINTQTAPVAVPLRLPNRAHSYLLDCSFLI